MADQDPNTPTAIQSLNLNAILISMKRANANNASPTIQSDDGDAFSDAPYTASLPESVALSIEEDGHDSMRDSYIIHRFLPAANAIASAASSAHRNPKRSSPARPSPPGARTPCHARIRAEAVPRVTSRCYSIPRACGLALLLPRRVGRTVRALKRPVWCESKRGDAEGSASGREGSGGVDSHDVGWGMPILYQKNEWEGEGARMSCMSTARKGELFRPPTLKSPSESWLSIALRAQHIE
ncbi:hypothetical protein QJS04_geneDACA006029 [Acorus gramineus]|uniref:Uncharacterized protein n=1 Tax=Acorus gramineus TaxID=55184 RepID=A0AAV9B1Y1_ACOGR|nr:hypothetical protein QJS04_geneDACA006029 [Acorus gramineus]